MKYNEIEKNYYSDLEEYEKENEINYMLDDDEQIIYKGKPNKKGFIFNKIFQMLPIVLIWLGFDSTFIVVFALNSKDMPIFALLFLIVFFIFHLTPVWIWLSGILTANKRHKNTIYLATNKRIMIRQGFISMEYFSLNYSEISEVNLKITFMDKMLHTGDIYFYTKNKNTKSHGFLDIENPYETYKLIQKCVKDIQTDIEFPNEYRPENNTGYNTKYKND